jgi:hypothetical protein
MRATASIVAAVPLTAGFGASYALSSGRAPSDAGSPRRWPASGKFIAPGAGRRLRA